MFTKGVHAKRESANFHPEFGYLCPSAPLRRKLRGAAVTILAVTMIAAGTALALMPRLAPHPSGDGVRAEPVLSVVAVPSIDQAAGKAEVNRPATAAALIAAPVTEQAAAARAQAACDDLSGSFLAARCRLGRTGKSRLARTARPASNRVAIVSIGRAGPGLESGPQAPAAPAAETAAAAPTAVAANDASLPPPEKRPVPAKKPVKMAHKPVPDHDLASADPMAPQHSRGFNLFSFFHETPRTGNGAGTKTW
jgi:hypothetical protein